MKKRTWTSEWYLIVILILMALGPLLPFFQPGLPHGHDAQDHVVRITNFYRNLSEGVIIPRWGLNLNWGYGHPVMMFLYPFSSYVASLFRFLGMSFVDATKAVFVVSYIASILSMYLFMRTGWGKRAGVLGAILYGFAPYRFVDMYVRMAIGEQMAFVFPPLIGYFLLRIAKAASHAKRPLFPYLAMGLAASVGGLILSHNAVSLMIFPVLGLFGLYLLVTAEKNRMAFFFHAVPSVLLGFGLAAFYWIPALIEGRYTLRDIVTAGEALNRFVLFREFFYSPWDYGGAKTITKEVGYPQWLGIILSLVFLWKSRNRTERMLIGGALVVFAGSLWIMTSASTPVWKAVMMLQNFQFPLRFLNVTVFVAALLSGLGLTYAYRNIAGMKGMGAAVRTGVFLTFCLLPLILTSWMWKPKGYQIERESFYTRVYPGTTDTGESTPIWTTRFMERYPPAAVEVISGKADIHQITRTSTVHEYQVVVQTRAELLENTVYFPGWQVYVDGQKTPIEFQSEIHRGILSFWVPEGTHRVRVAFENTKLRTLSEYVSLISLAVTAIGLPFAAFLWKRKQ